MAKEYMCAYGNCDKTDTPITVTDREAGEQSRYCCREHAGLHILRRAWHYEGQRTIGYADTIMGRLAKSFN